MAATDGINDFLRQEWIHRVHHPLLQAHGVVTDMLRLDRIHPFISGNKWLKLDYWMQRYQSGNYRGILTAGGPWSNHLHACAFACAQSGIPMQALVKGYAGMHTAMLQDLNDWNVQVRFTNRNAFYNRAAHEDYAGQHQLLYIPMGGDGHEGMQGVTSFFNRLPLEYYDLVCCAAGTGTTLAGIAASKHAFPQLTGYDPGTGDSRLTDRIRELLQACPSRQINLVHAGEKLGKPAAGLLIFLNSWQQQTGILLDVVYTGPMCRHFLEEVQSGKLTAGYRVLLVHTGGLQGNRSVETG